MIRIILYLLFCICTIIFVYTGFFKKDKVGQRLNEISRDLADMQDEDENSKKREKRTTLKFIRIPEKVRSDILASGIQLRVEEFVMIWISLVFFPPLLIYIFSANWLFSILIMIIMSILPTMYVKMKRKQRLNLFGEQLGDALPLISNGLRSGFSFEQAIAAVARDMPDPVSEEMTRVCRELALGMSLESSLNSLTERMENGDMELLTSAVLIQRKAGGNLADILDTVSNTIRERVRLKSHVKTLTAQGRYSGILIGGIPVFMFVALSAISPDYMSVFYTTLYGALLLAVVIVLEVTAFVVIKKMITLE